MSEFDLSKLGLNPEAREVVKLDLNDPSSISRAAYEFMRVANIAPSTGIGIAMDLLHLLIATSMPLDQTREQDEARLTELLTLSLNEVKKTILDSRDILRAQKLAIDAAMALRRQKMN